MVTALVRLFTKTPVTNNFTSVTGLESPVYAASEVFVTVVTYISY